MLKETKIHVFNGIYLQSDIAIDKNLHRTNEERSTETVDGALLVIIHGLYRTQKRYY
jgi:hypothetical protein